MFRTSCGGSDQGSCYPSTGEAGAAPWFWLQGCIVSSCILGAPARSHRPSSGPYTDWREAQLPFTRGASFG